jgi:H+-translocating NAD(P) transhydrogenase subunit alpha
VGATIVPTAKAFQSDIVLKVRPPDVSSEVGMFKEGGTLVSWIQPAINEDLVTKLQEKSMTVIGALFRPQRYFFRS